MVVDFIIRAARKSDMQAVAEINNHYISNTVMTFAEEPRSLAEYETDYETITATQRLPYLVAVDTSSSAVVGYSNAHLFHTRAAYRFTVEISLFCDPTCTGRGLGSRLLESLLDALRDPAAHPELAPPGARDDVKNVIALMAVDPNGKGDGLALKAFYERFGFVQVPLLIPLRKDICIKLDSNLDVGESASEQPVPEA